MRVTHTPSWIAHSDGVPARQQRAGTTDRRFAALTPSASTAMVLSPVLKVALASCDDEFRYRATLVARRIELDSSEVSDCAYVAVTVVEA